MTAFLNNWQATLASALSEGGTTLSLTGGADQLAEGQEYLLTLSNSLVVTEQMAWEVVKATRSGATVNVVRAQEGAARTWPAGSVVYCSLTAGTLSSMLARLTALENSSGGGGGNGIVTQVLADPGIHALDMAAQCVYVNYEGDGEGSGNDDLFLEVTIPEDAGPGWHVVDLYVSLYDYSPGSFILRPAADSPTRWWSTNLNGDDTSLYFQNAGWLTFERPQTEGTGRSFYIRCWMFGEFAEFQVLINKEL